MKNQDWLTPTGIKTALGALALVFAAGGIYNKLMTIENIVGELTTQIHQDSPLERKNSLQINENATIIAKNIDNIDKMEYAVNELNNRINIFATEIKNNAVTKEDKADASKKYNYLLESLGEKESRDESMFMNRILFDQINSQCVSHRYS